MTKAILHSRNVIKSKCPFKLERILNEIKDELQSL